MSLVTLIGVTAPRIAGVNSAEELIAYAARISNPGNQLNTETAPRLLAYLMKNKHWSPFEMVHVVMEFNTTRDIARQVIRHRSFSFQEFSQRYASAEELGFETREARLQDAKNRQASNPTEDKELIDMWEEKQTDLLIATKKVYTWALSNGIAKEQARAILPEGNTKSRLYVSGSVRSWIHYLQSRCENGTQKEHRDLATSARDILQKEFPSLSKLLEDSFIHP
jgi:thymidylate synthase (FAD)